MFSQSFLVCVLLVSCGLSLLQVRSLWSHKIGMTLIWIATGYGAFQISGSYWVAAMCLVSWIFFPVWEVFFVLRQLRVPRVRELTDARPPQEEEFEELSDLSNDLHDLGFRQVDECRVNPSPYPHYYRLFVHADGMVHAAIGYISQGSIGFHFVCFSSQTHDGRRWVTWDYPLTYGLVMPPEIAVYRVLQLDSLADLQQAHMDFLEINEISKEMLVTTELSRDAVRARLEKTLSRQIEYNVSHGYLAPDAGEDAENFRYSWRGTWFVAAQVIRDLFLF